ncbi:NAD(P)-binding domain-containing protein [Dankookia sp. P2]|uniref:NAD(P)-binding domain-containing protein n=1 Tax=Dankookia sp. P2 TaxID=3423955 RepID=UPI003D66B714
MDQVVGIIGLGIMGGAMARNLRDAGWRVVGFDTDAARCAALARRGSASRRTPPRWRGRRRCCSAACRSRRRWPPPPRRSPAPAWRRAPWSRPAPSRWRTSRRRRRVLRAAGHTLLDCPLSGTGSQAVTRDLVVYASGEAAAIEALGPFFAGFARAAR